MQLDLRSELVWAVGWKIVAELFRRHHARLDLHLLETHPGGGMYDCLSLYAGDFPGGAHLCDFNQASRHFHVFGQVGRPSRTLANLRWPDENDYVLAYLRSEDPKEIPDQVESVLGLPTSVLPLPPTTAPILAIRVIAEVLGRCAFDRVGLDVRQGVVDTSGPVGCGIREEIRTVPAIAAALPPAQSEAYRTARRFWLLRDRDDWIASPAAVVDMRGVAYAGSPPYTELRFWDQYQKVRRLPAVVDQVMKLCGRY